jgi:hypothetical protein
VQKRVAFLGIAVLGICLGLSAADDPMTGSWKLNVAKSKYSPGPAPRGETNRVEPYGEGGVKVAAVVTDAQGKKVNISYNGSFDGKEFPVSGDPNADSCSMKRVNARTMLRINKKAGKSTTTLRYVVSPDGQTKTIYTTGVDAQGQRVNNVAVFEKQ